VQDNLIDYVRADGSAMGLALVQAIDMTPNMVWVDKPLNQAKSNVVNQNSDTATNPPQRANMNAILTFPTFVDAADQIYKVEFFLRNLAAVGQYFAGTSQIFAATALNVQNLLSEITPSSVLMDDASLPLIFNTWLQNLVNTYPNGCTQVPASNVSRNSNCIQVAWDECVELLSRDHESNVYSTAAADTCMFPPYYFGNQFEQYNPSMFNAQLLMPVAPQSPRCNVPGTGGQVTYTQSYGTNNGEVQTMGSGNTNFYAVGSGPSISGSHVQGRALDGNTYQGYVLTPPRCTGSYIFNDVAANTAGYATANIAFTCGNGLGPQDVNIQFVMAGQVIPDCTLIRNNANSPWVALCSPTMAANTQCVQSFVLGGGVARRQLQPLTMAISDLGFSVLGGL
ncbi:hypothetical protein B0H12DRAFT_1281942, partial [Mycena haematopus]